MNFILFILQRFRKETPPEPPPYQPVSTLDEIIHTRIDWWTPKKKHHEDSNPQHTAGQDKK